MADDFGDELTGQFRGRFVALRLGQMSLQDRLGGPLPEVGFEDRRERESTSRSSSALLVSLRRHRR